MTGSGKTRSHDAREVWERKPSLRRVYTDLYARLTERLVPGTTVEIGGGSGNFKDFAPDSISTDIVAAPWLDAVADAGRLPFADASVANFVLFDVLHHIEFALRFFDEAGRVLEPGGRIIICEPAITPLSNLFYSYMHPEPVEMGADIFNVGEPNPSRDPFDANQAIPTLMFCQQSDRFARHLPMLKILDVQLNSLFAYPLTGGFRSWTAIPAALVPPMLSLESILLPILGPLMAFRMLVTIERRA
ncbi:MAG: SAM-dependent methyltransferase [Alphaproteobacteria bacterium]|nr:SAM-dependent methyltransferase [Alphaproteobacteria bacterium]